MKFLFIASIQTARRSSARITAGLFINARATATRCFSPPDNSAGLCEARSDKPKKASVSLAFRIASEEDVPAINAGIITFSKAVNSGSNWWNWNTKPICRLRKADNSFSFKQLTSVPFSKIVPYPPCPAFP